MFQLLQVVPYVKQLKINYLWGVVFVDSSEEEDAIEEESEAVVYRKPTTYDNLLASLGSSNKAVADMNKRRYLYINTLKLFG